MLQTGNWTINDVKLFAHLYYTLHGPSTNEEFECSGAILEICMQACN